VTLSSAALLLGGLILLVVGGEVLVRGAGGLARAMGMSPLLVGLTVVAFATSAPELAVAVSATLGGNPGLAVGNVVGSNIANVLLVLGMSAVILPVIVGAQVLRRDIPVVALLSALVLGMSLDLRISRAEGLVLVAALAAYLVGTVLAARRAGADQPEDDPDAGPAPAASRRAGGLVPDMVLVAVGVALLVAGANWLVEGATQVARSFGVSDLVIGLTVVAIGTSLPELATSLIAALRGERDMAVGNIVGSCVFNLGAVLGLSAVIAVDGIPMDPAAVRFDLPFMLATAIALLPVAFTGMAIARWEGVVFVAYYAAYIAYLVLTATSHPALPAFGVAMRTFVIPLTALTLGILMVDEVRRRRARPAGTAQLG
jgi:cation:H+ antiporter